MINASHSIWARFKGSMNVMGVGRIHLYVCELCYVIYYYSLLSSDALLQALKSKLFV